SAREIASRKAEGLLVRPWWDCVAFKSSLRSRMLQLLKGRRPEVLSSERMTLGARRIGLR
ncbi:MAG: hypothetical protein PVH65_11820, partial [Chloroflexota bacterium]